MIVIVTGAAGFIGSHLSERLLEKGHIVIGIDNFDPYYDSQIKRNNIKPFENNNNFFLYETSILDQKNLHKIFLRHKPEKVVHLAAKVGVRPSLADPVSYEEVNVKGTKNLLDVSVKFGIKNFVFASSSSVYGLNQVPFNENETPSPISVYASTKLKGELLCREYHDRFGLNITCLRFFTVYGPRGRPDMAIYKFTKLIRKGNEIEIYGDGSSKRDYTYVEDIVSGIVSALDRNIPFDIFNLGNSHTVELKYLISLIEKEFNRKAKIRHMPEQEGDVPVTYADIRKSNKELDYTPRTKIEDGIKKFVKWFKEQNKDM